MRNESEGTTLPELMIVMAIMGVLLYLAQSVVVYGYQFYRSIDESITLQREGLLALTRITQDAAITHQLSLVVLPIPSPPGPAREDELVMPMPRKIDGTPVVNTKGALTWRSLVGYKIDVSTHRLMRYVADSADDPNTPNQFLTGNPTPDNYTENIEFVTNMPTIADMLVMPSLNTRVAARNVLWFQANKKVDTLDLELTIFFPGRNGAADIDNSLQLRTTVYPKN